MARRDLKEYKYIPLIGSKKDNSSGIKFELSHFLKYWSFGYLKNCLHCSRSDRETRRARKLYGSAPADAWNFDASLLSFIHNGLSTLAKDAMGSPVRNEYEVTLAQSEEEADQEKLHAGWLAEIIYCRDLAKTILEFDDDFPVKGEMPTLDQVESHNAQRQALIDELFTWLAQNLTALWD